MNKKKTYGFVLMEMIIYMGLLAILLTVLTGIFLTTLDAQLESQTASSIEQDGRFILGRLIYDISRAQNITTPVNVGDSGNTLLLTIDGIGYTYIPNGGNLLLTKSGTTDQLNGFDTSISSLTFQRLGNTGGKNSIRISFTITSKTQRTSGAESKTFQTTAALR